MSHPERGWVILEPQQSALTIGIRCEYCGVELVAEGSGAVQRWHHPDGVCPQFPVLSIEGEILTFQEFKALVRVARAQLEIEAKRRGSEESLPARGWRDQALRGG